MCELAETRDSGFGIRDSALGRGIRGSGFDLGFAIVLGASLILFAASPARAELTEGPRLAAIYDTILNAEFDRAGAELKRACPPAPVEACRVLEVVSLWWQIQIHPESRLLDKRFTTLAESSIEAANAWAKREPVNAEAWFYLAGSYAPLVQWQVLRGERLAAARAGNRIKSALERALELDPDLADAHFGIGAYHYYADVAPAAAKLIRWLLFLPGGNRVKGLQEMLQARDHGELLRGEADYQLHLIDLWYEHKPREALDRLMSLDRRYPFNPHFLQRIAEVQAVYFHDHDASANAWQELLDRAERGAVYDPPMAATRARLGLATELVELNRPADAIEHLKIVIAAHPIAPAGARTRAETMMHAIVARQVRK